jgi:hypothetical protein
MDKYNERLVKAKAGAPEVLMMVGSVLLAVIGLGVFLMVSFSIGFLLLAVGIFLVTVTMNNLNVEYEYTLVNGDIDVAKIIAMKRRKAMKSIVEGDIICMDRSDSHKVQYDKNENPQVMVKDYTMQDPDKVYYAIYTNEGGKTVMNLFDFDEKCVEHMQFYLKTKCLFK